MMKLCQRELNLTYLTKINNSSSIYNNVLTTEGVSRKRWHSLVQFTSYYGPVLNASFPSFLLLRSQRSQMKEPSEGRFRGIILNPVHHEWRMRSLKGGVARPPLSPKVPRNTKDFLVLNLIGGWVHLRASGMGTLRVVMYIY